MGHGTLFPKSHASVVPSKGGMCELHILWPITKCCFTMVRHGKWLFILAYIVGQICAEVSKVFRKAFLDCHEI